MTDLLPCALVLDFGGVVTQTLFETHEMTEAALGLPAGTLSWQGPFDPATDPLWRRMQLDEISERDYWSIRAREVGDLVGETWQCMSTFVQRARGADPAAILRAEAVKAIGTAAANDIRLAILSNELDLFYGTALRSRLPLLSQFEVIIDATYTHILKPDPRAYEAVCSALALPPGRCVFVDDQQRNIDGAIAAGMIAVHFDVTGPRRSYSEALRHFGLRLE